MQLLMVIKQNCKQSYVFESNFPYVASHVINKEYVISTTSLVCNYFSLEDSVLYCICVSVGNRQSLKGILPHL